VRVFDGCLILSPHRDDAILSCGGLAAALQSDGRPATIVNVFGGTAEPPALSDFARGALAALGVETFAEAAALRSAEDARARAIVGARSVDLDFLPAPIRSPYFTGWESIVGAIPPGDAKLAAAIVDALHRTGLLAQSPWIVGPLAMGNHVDHALVRIAGAALASRGYRVAFFEDFPYCVSDDVLEEWADPPGMQACTFSLGAFAAAKIAAIRCYGSQLAALFPENVEAALSKNAARLAEDGPAERYWLAPRLAPAFAEALAFR